MKTFLDYTKDTEKAEMQRQVDHHEEMAEKHKEKAEQCLMMGDIDGHALHMAKHEHFKTQGENLKGIKEEVEQLNELKKSTVRSYVNKKQAELDDVPPMPFKKPARSKSQIQRDAKGMMGALARLSGKKPTSEGVIEESELDEASPAWQRKEGKSASGGLNRKGIASYRKANPGSKLSMAVTTKPSKLKPGSKAANRRKSFCARMSGMKKRLTSAKTAKDPNSRINKSLRKWNC